MQTLLWLISGIVRVALAITGRFASVALVGLALLALVILCDENDTAFPFQPRSKFQVGSSVMLYMLMILALGAIWLVVPLSIVAFGMWLWGIYDAKRTHRKRRYQ
jgi:hypothetical protein